MKVFVCRICGDSYIGKEIPGSCPFCGVEKKFLVLAHIWKNEYDVELTDPSKKNLEEALRLETSNVKFYKCVEETSTNTEIQKVFKGLRKVEAEHVSVFKKFLKIDKDPEAEEVCIDDVMKSLEESSVREQRAIDFYMRAAGEATEPRIKEVFTAITKVEQDHLTLDREMMEKYKDR